MENKWVALVDDKVVASGSNPQDVKAEAVRKGFKDFAHHLVPSFSKQYFMKLGIILQSNKPEHAWNTFRLGITALKASHQVEIFLMNEGSELDTIPDSNDFDVSAKVKEFIGLKGEMYVCGTCLKVRGKEESKICPVSTMSDLLKMVESSDKVLVFG